MVELTKEEKDSLVIEAVKVIEKIARLHKLTLVTMPKVYVSFLVEVFVAGASVAIQQSRKVEQQIETVNKPKS